MGGGVRTRSDDLRIAGLQRSGAATPLRKGGGNDVRTRGGFGNRRSSRVSLRLHRFYTAAHRDLGKHRGPEDTKGHRGQASVILCASEFFSGRDARQKSVVHFHET